MSISEGILKIILQSWEGIKELAIYVNVLIIIALLYALFSIVMKFVEKRMLLHAHSKNQITNVELFVRATKYLFLAMLIIAAIFAYSGSFTGLGLTLGLLSAAIGFALQRPIASIAAWVFIVIKRPFAIGDRIIIKGTKGDVREITLSHIYLREIGGILNNEERTGRIVIVPNHLIFDELVVNYSLQDDYVLGEVFITVTFESDLDKAIKMCIEAAHKRVDQYLKLPTYPKQRKPPHVRVTVEQNGMGISLRYYVPFEALQEVKSDISTEVHKKIEEEKGIKMAYQHVEIVQKKAKN